MENKETQTIDLNKNHLINRLAYSGLLLTGIVFVFFKDWSSATIMLGIALVFDPFDTSVSFGKRPLWQKTWLIVHLALVFVAFGIEITR